MFQYRLFSILALVVLVSVLAAGARYLLKGEGRWRLLAEIDCGKDRYIFIEERWEFDSDNSLHYSVSNNDKMIIQRTFIPLHGMAMEQSFEAAHARNESVTAVFASTNPYRFLVVHDFENSESWPHDDTGYIGAQPRSFAVKRRRLEREIEEEHAHLGKRAMLLDVEFFRRLDRVDLSDTDMSDDHLKAFTADPQTRVLRLERNPITDDGIGYLAHASELEVLHLSNTKVRGRSLATLSNLNLLGLYVDETLLDDQGLVSIGKLTQLHHLDLSGTSVTGKGLKFLYGLKDLRLLNLEGTDINRQEVEEIERRIPGLVIIQ